MINKELEFQKLKKKGNATDTFLDALKYEKSNHAWADEWYKKHLNAESIIRWDWDEPIGHYKQQNDIDCTIQKEDTTLNISEKFRSVDFGDMFIEIYSMYPSVPGWAIKSAADLIAYHTPTRSYLVNAKQIELLAELVLIGFDADDNKEEIIRTGSGSGFIKIPNFKNPDLVHNLKVKYKAIKTFRPGCTSWTGVGFCITWNALDKLGIKYKEIVNHLDESEIKYNTQF